MFEPTAKHKVNLTNCDREPISVPGSIQPHGLMLGLNRSDLTIAIISNNTHSFFGVLPERLLSKSLQSLMDKNSYNSFLNQLLSGKDVNELNPLGCKLVWEGKEVAFDVTIHQTDGLLILELEPCILRDREYIESFFHKIKKTIAKFENASDMQHLLQTAAMEIRNITDFDRVMVYKFDANEDGEVVAEAKVESVEPFLGLRYPATDIPQQARQLYLKNWLRLIVDVDYTPAMLTPQTNPLTQQPIDMSSCVLRSVSPIHIQYLKNMGVKSSMSISLIKDKKLWGLIACHHYQPKFVNYEYRAVCEFLGQVLSWQIANQANISSQKYLMTGKDYIHKITESISLSEDWIKDLLNQQDSLLKLLDAQGVVIKLNGNFHTAGEIPSKESIETLVPAITKNFQDGLIYTDCIKFTFPQIAKTDNASGFLALSLAQNTDNMIIWFRVEMVRTVNWAGNPHKLFSDAKETLTPRRSFALWQEKVQYKCASWTEDNLKLAHEFKRYVLEIIYKQEQKSVEIAKQEQRHRDEFLDTVCHEIRNPLNGILGSATLLKSYVTNLKRTLLLSSSSEYAKQTEAIIKNIEEQIDILDACSEQQTVIVNDVLDLSRLESKKITLEPVVFKLSELIDSVVTMFRPQLLKKNLGFELKIICGEAILKADDKRVSQVLINLVSNAVKFTNVGKITISAKLETLANGNQYLSFTVEDTGRGIDKPDIQGLFDRFSHASRKRSNDKLNSSGLGLSICKKLVDIMGGNITVESQQYVGSKFTFTVLCYALTEEEKLNAQSVAKRKTIEELKAANLNLDVLVVEDNSLNQKILTKYLAGWNCSFKIAQNGREALEQFNQYKFDLILMDIEMPIMDGIEATKRIREKELLMGYTIPIIGLSGNSRREQIQAALTAGMNAYVTKPYHAHDILPLLEKYAISKDANVAKRTRKNPTEVEDIKNELENLAETKPRFFN